MHEPAREGDKVRHGELQGQHQVVGRDRSEGRRDAAAAVGGGSTVVDGDGSGGDGGDGGGGEGDDGGGVAVTAMPATAYDGAGSHGAGGGGGGDGGRGDGGDGSAEGGVGSASKLGLGRG